MSLRCLTWAFHDAPTDDPLDTLVLVALADEANDQGLSCFAGLRTLGRKTRSSPSTVAAAGQRLHDQGLITVARPVAGGPGKSNHYVIHVPWQDPADVATYVERIRWPVDVAPAEAANRSAAERLAAADRAAQGARSDDGNRAAAGQNRAAQAARNRAQPRGPGPRVPTNPVVTNPGGTFLAGSGVVPDRTGEKPVGSFEGAEAGIEALRRARRNHQPNHQPGEQP